MEPVWNYPNFGTLPGYVNDLLTRGLPHHNMSNAVFYDGHVETITRQQISAYYQRWMAGKTNGCEYPFAEP